MIGNDIFVNAMRGCGKVKVLVSEELDEAIVFPGTGRYIVVCDPIDGSSNLDAGVSVGTIFGIFKLGDNAVGAAEDALKPGTELVAAGFTMYGASANLVLTMKGGDVNGFTLDNALGEFILSHPKVGGGPFLRSCQGLSSFHRCTFPNHDPSTLSTKGTLSTGMMPAKNILTASSSPKAQGQSHTRLGILDPWWQMYTEHYAMGVYSPTPQTKSRLKVN